MVVLKINPTAKISAFVSVIICFMIVDFNGECYGYDFVPAKRFKRKNYFLSPGYRKNSKQTNMDDFNFPAV